MIEDVECFQPELKGVMFAVRHRKLLMDCEIDRLKMWCDERIPPDIAEGSRWRDYKCGRIVPSCGGGIRGISTACPSEAGAIVIGGVGSRIYKTNIDRLRHTALDRHVCTQLPATDEAIHDGVVDTQALVSADGKIIDAAQ